MLLTWKRVWAQATDIILIFVNQVGIHVAVFEVVLLLLCCVQLQHYKTLTLLVHAGLFWCFHNPLNSDMGYRIFSMRMRSFLHAYTYRDFGLKSHLKDFLFGWWFWFCHILVNCTLSGIELKYMIIICSVFFTNENVILSLHSSS